ncbi:MAG: hypothetical protein FWE80_07465 [Oscillospiraceae bacterium]|nr:hypothetical protein [Oscillospiraceae bacterium]
MMKKSVFGIMLMLFSMMFCIPASANSPAPAEYLTFEITGLPDTVVYVDLLIKIDGVDNNFSEINQENLDENGFSRTAQIVTYDQDGFRSFTFHYQDDLGYKYEQRSSSL